MRTIPTFPVLLGVRSPAELRRIADTTDGTVLDGRKADLSQVFKEIRRYR